MNSIYSALHCFLAGRPLAAGLATDFSAGLATAFSAELATAFSAELATALSTGFADVELASAEAADYSEEPRRRDGSRRRGRAWRWPSP